MDGISATSPTLLSLLTSVTNSYDTAVVTCASIQAGDAENVVIDSARLAIDIRTTKPATRTKVLASVKRIVEAESLAGNAVAPPTFLTTRTFPLTINDDTLTSKLEESFGQHFPNGKEGYVADVSQLAGSEDFSILASAVGKPYSFFVYGGTAPEKWDKAEAEDRLSEDLPVNHSGLFAPVIQPTLRVGMLLLR
jgi:metal-dependent amidase/aminoacylase/carboxypeptidase family protein